MKIIASLLITLALIAVAAVGYLAIEAHKVDTRNSAIDTCYQAGRVTFRQYDANGFEIQQSELPANDTFKECMQYKGL
jgi:hypothetical protein